MDFIRNFPFFCILICMSSGVVNSVLKGKTARKVSIGIIIATLLMSIATLYYVTVTGTSYVYIMGHHEAPWGNEIRFGVLEAVFATFFSGIMLLSVVGGLKHCYEECTISIPLLAARCIWLFYANIKCDFIKFSI